MITVLFVVLMNSEPSKWLIEKTAINNVELKLYLLEFGNLFDFIIKSIKFITYISQKYLCIFLK